MTDKNRVAKANTIWKVKSLSQKHDWHNVVGISDSFQFPWKTRQQDVMEIFLETDTAAEYFAYG